MRYGFLPFPLFQTRPKRNGVKTGHASCPPKFLNENERELQRNLRLYRARHRSVAASLGSRQCSLNKRLTFQSEYGPSSEAWTDPGSAVAVSAATAAAAVRAFAAIAASAAGASAPPAALLIHWRSAASGAGVPGPVSAGVFAVPVPAARIPFPAAADTSGPASGRLSLEHWVARPVEGREDGRAGWVEKHYCLDAVPSSLDAERGSPERKHCYVADFRRDWPCDWQEEYKARLALSPARRRDRSMLLVLE